LPVVSCQLPVIVASYPLPVTSYRLADRWGYVFGRDKVFNEQRFAANKHLCRILPFGILVSHVAMTPCF